MGATPTSGMGEGRSGVRRRPSGEPAPLPRHPLEGSGKFWLALALVLVLIIMLLMSSTTFVLGRGAFWDDLDQVFVDRVNDIRTGALTAMARWTNALANPWFLRIARWAIVVVLIFYKR